MEVGGSKVAGLAVLGCLAGALLLGVAACDDGGDGGGGKVRGRQLVIYSSLPLQGAARVDGRDVADGATLAVERVGGRVKDFTIRYVSLDDATPDAGKWEPEQVTSNARRAAQDPKTIAYLGDFDSDATAISLPIVNRAGILQVSPASTYVGLTRSEGTDPGEPDKYYPTGTRTFARIILADHVQAAAQVAWMKEQGVKRLYVVHDGELYGSGLAELVEESAEQSDIDVVANERVDATAADDGSLASKIGTSGAEAMFYGATTAGGAVALWRKVYAADPALKLFGPDRLADPGFATEIGPAAKNTFITSPTLDPKLYPPRAADFFRDFEQKHGRPAGRYAIYGYEAMAAILEAIKAAGESGNDRQAVIDAFFDTDNRESVLGTYSIDENGDTTLTDYGGYRIAGGELSFDKILESQP